MDSNTQGARIRALFSSSKGDFVVIAPFIKIKALKSLLDVIPIESHLSCVTRWLPRDVAAGVSDPEIFDLLEERGNFNLSLADQLHAKLYVAGNRCLAGSANVTLAGLGEVDDGGNIEVLVETVLADPGVSATLEAIEKASRRATREMARAARLLGQSLADHSTSDSHLLEQWVPRSRLAEHAFKFYTNPPTEFLGAAELVLISDIASTNLPPGLSEDKFRVQIRSLLGSLPLAKLLLEDVLDTTLTRSDANPWLETVSTEVYSTKDLWIAFVNWMSYFFQDLVIKQEVTEFNLRRAKLLT